jgi:uncharacterized protein YaaN involved in tellurite resistance
MVDRNPTSQLDLSLFDDLDSAPARALTAPPAAQPAVAADPRLAPQPEPERLVEIANLGREDLAAAEAAAAKIDFRNTNTLLSHGEGVLGGIAQASRQLLAGVRLEDAGEVGHIAASVIDGIKILRIEDLQAQADGSRPEIRPGG